MEELKWISVEDALPPIGKRVITKDSKNIGVGCIDKYVNEAVIKQGQSQPKMYPVWRSTDNVFGPTHWMILPKTDK